LSNIDPQTNICKDIIWRVREIKGEGEKERKGNNEKKEKQDQKIGYWI